jgi:tetratricopeptide (TPR) repeat protein
MTKPDPPRFLLGRLFSSMLIAVVLWTLLSQSGAIMPGIAQFMFDRRIAPFAVPLSTGDTNRARALFEKEIQSNPADPSVYQFIYAACGKFNHYDLAREYLERSLIQFKDAPRSQRAALYGILADCYTHTDKAKPQLKAILAAQRAAELDPESVEYLNESGYLQADNDWQLDDAVFRTKHALELLKKAPKSVNTPRLAAVVEDSYGWALYKQGRYDEAASALSQAISDFPSEESGAARDTNESLGTLYYHLGAANRRLQRRDAARQALQTALAYMPNNGDAKEELEGLKSAPPAPKPAAGTHPGPGQLPAHTPEKRP